MWLSGLSTGRQTKGSLVQFPVKAHAWVAGQVPSGRHVRCNHTLMSLSLSLPPSLPLCLKINKILKKKSQPKKLINSTLDIWSPHQFGNLERVSKEWNWGRWEPQSGTVRQALHSGPLQTAQRIHEGVFVKGWARQSTEKGACRKEKGGQSMGLQVTTLHTCLLPGPEVSNFKFLFHKSFRKTGALELGPKISYQWWLQGSFY